MSCIKVKLDRAHCRELLLQMLRIRRFEEKCAELYTQEKIRGFLHLYIGEEANAIALPAIIAEDCIMCAPRRSWSSK